MEYIRLTWNSYLKSLNYQLSTPGVASVGLVFGPRITAFVYSSAGASETAVRDCTAWWESAVEDGLAASGWLFLAVQMRWSARCSH